MSLHSYGTGGFRIAQHLTRPVVYMDHWAIRLFSEEPGLQRRFVDALHSSNGTWLFSSANLVEFVAMTDLTQAVAVEHLLLQAMPSVHVADTMVDRGYLFPDGAPAHPDAPDQDWLLDDLAERARIAGGVLNTKRFIQDGINHRGKLQPLFDKMKKEVSGAVMTSAQNEAKRNNAKKFVPRAGMTLRDALSHELLREAHINPAYKFNENDAMDFIHAIPAVVVCDFVLLDAGWCSKVENAAKRLRKGGVTGKIARCFSRKTVPEFLTILESMKSPTS